MQSPGQIPAQAITTCLKFHHREVFKTWWEGQREILKADGAASVTRMEGRSRKWWVSPAHRSPTRRGGVVSLGLPLLPAPWFLTDFSSCTSES